MAAVLIYKALGQLGTEDKKHMVGHNCPNKLKIDTVYIFEGKGF